MNKLAKIIISVISVVLVLVIGSVAILIAENHVPQNDMKLFGDYYMARFSVHYFHKKVKEYDKNAHKNKENRCGRTYGGTCLRSNHDH